MRKFLGCTFLILLAAAVLTAGYVAFALWYSYSEGERAGYIQKFSRKGWVCKTWEGELAMANLPGTMPEVFAFSVRDDATAASLNGMMGRRVVLTYEQHLGIPTDCFGETSYFVVGARPATD